MLINRLMNLSAVEMRGTARRENVASEAETNADSPSFDQIHSDKQVQCPYGYLAKDGVIQYNGATFMCDPDTNSICMGDMWDPKKVLNVNLPSGGQLKININNFGDISRAVSMFSPEDLGAIMRAIYQYNHCTAKLEELDGEESKVMDAADNDKQADQTFSELKEKLIEEHRLTPDNIKKEDDWREMDEEQWDKLIGHIDQYIDDFKEKLKHMEEVRKEAAMKAMAEAPAAMRAAAASKAMLHAMSGGIAGGESDGDVSELEKLSWTYELETDDQVVLATAKMANEFAPDMLSKSQEIALTGDTSVGISETENLKECASVTEDANQKVWTITAFGQDGIICKQCTMDGESKELWRIDYKNAGDAEKVWKFLEQFDKDADLKFAGSKEFWEDFL